MLAVRRADALQRLARNGAEREAAWQAIVEIGARDSHLDPDEVERDIPAEIEAMRSERCAKLAQRGAR